MRKWLTWRRFSAIRAVFYTVMLGPAYMLDWLKSVPFVSILSVVALIESAIAAWRADVPTKEGGS